MTANQGCGQSKSEKRSWPGQEGSRQQQFETFLSSYARAGELQRAKQQLSSLHSRAKHKAAEVGLAIAAPCGGVRRLRLHEEHESRMPHSPATACPASGFGNPCVPCSASHTAACARCLHPPQSPQPGQCSGSSQQGEAWSCEERAGACAAPEAAARPVTGGGAQPPAGLRPPRGSSPELPDSGAPPPQSTATLTGSWLVMGAQAGQHMHVAVQTVHGNGQGDTGAVGHAGAPGRLLMHSGMREEGWRAAVWVMALPQHSHRECRLGSCSPTWSSAVSSCSFLMAASEQCCMCRRKSGARYCAIRQTAAS